MSMPTYHITIMDKIKACRNKKNLPLKEFGKSIGVPEQMVYKQKQNNCYPNIISLLHLARILECKIDDFFVIYGGCANE